MQKTILQVPLDKHLKNTAEKAATEQGFSSLQEIIRVFLTQLAQKKVEVTLHEPLNLSSKNEDRYSKMEKDFESNKNIESIIDVKNLLKKLNAD
jgi:antitoxin component of RelBE/YafQ-DinJ toxin-antitoxin module